VELTAGIHYKKINDGLRTVLDGLMVTAAGQADVEALSLR